MRNTRISFTLQDSLQLLFTAELSIAVMDLRSHGEHREGRVDEVAFTQKIRQRLIDRGLLDRDSKPLWQR